MTIGIIGAGNMASALVRGWAEPVLITDGGSGRAHALAGEVHGEALASNAELAARADLVILCHKPAQLQAVAAEASDARAVVSVLAGVGLEQLRAAYPAAEVACAMPNTPVAIRQGVTVIADDPEAQPAFFTRCHELFERVGAVVVVPARLMGVAGSLSGVLPAYVALVAEAQIDAGIRRGVPGPLATEIIAAAMAGSAALLREQGGDTLGMRREVTSPGGTTARGLAALENGGVRAAFADALDAVLGG